MNYIIYNTNNIYYIMLYNYVNIIILFLLFCLYPIKKKKEKIVYPIKKPCIILLKPDIRKRLHKLAIQKRHPHLLYD